ncbi:nucleolar protein 7 [Chanos chanos]|uniref:Nucleolar protein 7 n=1 Tax=Chanos chanos TaxID=29144 RepID=A0A6J2VJD6_CHACN|nr:nucleolar protein 7 [Chanos chanos]
MAKAQRGDPDSSSEDTINEKMVDHVDSTDDEAPDEVAFEDSKTVALQSVKNALESARRERESLKEKRRKRQLLFQEQKKRRLLPEDLLEELETAPTTQQEQQLPSENKDEDEEEPMKKQRKASKVRSLQGNYSVMRVKDDTIGSSQQQAAMDFIQSRLYGKGIQRMTNAQLLSLEKKRGPNKGAAVQFANKQMSAEDNAKAQKCNKRWIRKKNLVPS